HALQIEPHTSRRGARVIPGATSRVSARPGSATASPPTPSTACQPPRRAFLQSPAYPWYEATREVEMKSVRSTGHARQDERRRDALEDLVARGFTRRHLLRVAALVGAGATAPPLGGERALAQLSNAGAIPDDAVKINANE